MAFSRVQIISYALTLLGRKPVTSLSNQGDIVNSADQAFDLLLTTAMSISFWRFATTISQLQLLNETPTGGYWRYSYALPPDYLKMIHLYPTIRDFEIYKNCKLYSNFNGNIQVVNPDANQNALVQPTGNPLYIEYIFLPDVTMLPPYFVKYFAYELASYLALSNAQVPDYIAEIERRRTIELSIAQAADTQNRPQTPLRDAPMLSLRHISTFVQG